MIDGPSGPTVARMEIYLSCCRGGRLGLALLLGWPPGNIGRDVTRDHPAPLIRFRGSVTRRLRAHPLLDLARCDVAVLAVKPQRSGEGRRSGRRRDDATFLVRSWRVDPWPACKTFPGDGDRTCSPCQSARGVGRGMTVAGRPGMLDRIGALVRELLAGTVPSKGSSSRAA